MPRILATTLIAIFVSGCRIGFDATPLVGAGDDAAPAVDADPAAPDASTIDAGPDAGAATATRTQKGLRVPEAASEEIAIDPVLLSESFVTCSRRSGSSQPSLNLARCKLVNGSTLRIESSGLDSSAVTAWAVTQVPGAVVQRGTVSLAGTELEMQVSIDPVDRTRSFALVSTTTSMTGSDDDERWNVAIELTADDTIRLRRGSTGADVTIDFQVIQFATATVHAGSTVLANGMGSATAVHPSVDMSRSFVVYSSSLDADIDGEEARYLTRPLLSASDLTFTRQVAGEALALSWFIVELPAPSSVKTYENATTAPHDELVLDIVDASFTDSMISFTNVEIDSGVLRNSLGAASLSSVVSAGLQRIERVVSDGNPLLLRTTAVDIVMP